MPKIEVNDINIYYEVHGEGFPLVMITGSAADVNWWIPETIESLSHFFKTIIFDNRGTGRTDKPDIPYSIQMMANDTIGLMDALLIQKAHILGVSLGGMIAQEIAINYPEKIERLILCCTGCGGSKAVIPSNKIIRMMTTVRNKTPEKFVDTLVNVCLTDNFKKNNPGFVAAYKERAMEYVISLKSYQHQMQANMSFNSYIKFKRIKASTLIMHGKEDVVVPPGNAEVLVNKIPNAKLVMLDNTGHLIFQPEPEKVVNTTKDFLTEKIEIEA